MIEVRYRRYVRGSRARRGYLRWDRTWKEVKGANINVPTNAVVIHCKYSRDLAKGAVSATIAWGTK